MTTNVSQFSFGCVHLLPYGTLENPAPLATFYQTSMLYCCRRNTRASFENVSPINTAYCKIKSKSFAVYCCVSPAFDLRRVYLGDRSSLGKMQWRRNPRVSGALGFMEEHIYCCYFCVWLRALVLHLHRSTSPVGWYHFEIKTYTTWYLVLRSNIQGQSLPPLIPSR